MYQSSKNNFLQRLVNTNTIKNSCVVFVYGTLKSGEPNNGVLKNDESGQNRFVGSARTVERFPLIVASKYNIPFCLKQPGTGHRIHGEVYEVDESKMEFLDKFESHPQFYTRQLHQVEMNSGEVLMAWIYLLPSWKPELLQEGSEFLENYTSSGSHGRPYVDR
ncbi:unnamed protein product [Anisakis simplex]|uniref:Gamma-glutamylcyclotransferase family protein n=1 Tax=Anisakis simplex TaxID=6269 RepID=A0A0M3K5G7_ANISI|nr:unnamed protein product [Anisakis simplex]